MTELIVEDAPSQPPLATLPQLKAQLDIKRPVHDTELELYLAAASNAVRARVVIDEAAVPPEATLATLIIADHLWQTQRGSDSRPGVDDERGQALLGFAIPRRAEQLLAGLTSARSGPVFSFPPAPVYPAG